MTITRIDRTAAPEPMMSRCVVYGDWIYLSGFTARDPVNDIKGQTEQILTDVDEYLAKVGSDKSRVLTAQIWLKDMTLFSAMNEVWNCWIDPEHPPARTCVSSELCHPDYLVEIMVTATR